jgi:putative transposase
MKIRKAYEFLLKPTKKQARLLEEQLDECRWLYNEFLQQRRLSFEEIDIPISKYQQLMLLPFLKEERTSLKKVHSQVLQNVVDRLEKAFQGFYRRCKAKEKAGFPRFRGKDRYTSFCYPQSGFFLDEKDVKLSKIGCVRIHMHRPVVGEIKTATLKKEVNGSWKIIFSCEVEKSPLPKNDKKIALDVGIENFATLTSGEVIENPRFFRQGEKKIAKVQRKLSKLQKGTKAREKQKKIVAKTHQKIRNQRKDFCHKQAKKIVEKYQYIYVEDLKIQKMIQSSYLAKSITDVSWNQFQQFLIYKAEEAGRILELVNPAYTSQTCNRCGIVKAKQLSEREHNCKICGYRASRDFNAAQNILALGLDGQGVIPRSLRL